MRHLRVVPWIAVCVAFVGCSDPNSEDGCSSPCASGTVCVPSVRACVTFCYDDTSCPDGQMCETNGLCAPRPDWLEANAGNRTTVPAEGLVLDQAGSPHVLLYDLYVPYDTTLTIEAGATVRVASGRSIIVDGELRAVGRASAMIIFEPSEGSRWGGIVVNGPRTASSLSYAEVHRGSVTVRGTLAEVDHVAFIDSWLDVAEREGFTVRECTFASVAQEPLGYSALSTMDVGALQVLANRFANIPGAGLVVRACDRADTVTVVSANAVVGTVAEGARFETRRAASLVLSGNSIVQAGGNGIAVVAPGAQSSGDLTLALNGNYVAQSGESGVLVDSDRNVQVAFGVLEAAAATAVENGSRDTQLDANAAYGVRISGARAVTVSLSHLINKNSALDGILIDGRGLDSATTDVVVRDVTVDGTRAGDGVRVLAPGGGSVNLAALNLSNIIGRGVNVEMASSGSVSVDNTTTVSTTGEGVRLTSLGRFSNVALSDVRVAHAGGAGVSVDGREGVTVQVGDNSAASAIVGVEVDDVAGHGLSVTSRADIVAVISHVTVSHGKSYGIEVNSLGGSEVAINGPISINDVSGMGIRSYAWRVNNTRLDGTAAAIAVRGSWDYGALVQAQDQIIATIDGLVVEDGNGSGIGVVQYQEQLDASLGSALTLRIANNHIARVHGSGIIVRSEAAVADTANDDFPYAVEISSNWLSDISDNGVDWAARNGVANIYVANNIVGDDDGDASDGDCATTGATLPARDYADYFTVGAVGVTVTSSRGQVGPVTLAENQICNVRSTGLYVTAAINGPVATNQTLAVVTFSDNKVVNARGTGIEFVAQAAQLSGNRVQNSGAGVRGQSGNSALYPNISITRDEYVYNRGTGIELASNYAFARLTTVRSNSNGSTGLTITSNSIAEILGSQLLDNGAQGVYSAGSWSKPSWISAENSCVGWNGQSGIVMQRDTYLPQTLPVGVPSPALTKTCVFENRGIGISGIAPARAETHWWATTVDDCNVVNNADRGVLYAGMVSRSYVNYNPANVVCAAAGTCVQNGTARGASNNAYTAVCATSSAQIEAVGCIDASATTARGLRAEWNALNKSGTYSVLGCAPEVGSPITSSPPDGC